MPKLSPSQLRAARALLNWSRAKLAKLSGISEPTLHRFENGENEPTARTVEKLFKIFDNHGIEFTEYNGVRFKPSNVEIYEGPERYDEFFDFLYEYIKEHGREVEVCLSISDQYMLDKYRKDPSLHYTRVKALYDSGLINRWRIMATRSAYMHSPLFSTFKMQPEGGISPTGFWAFGDCLALISFIHNPPPYVVLIRSATLAEAYRQAFNVAWAVAKNPVPPASGNRKDRNNKIQK